MKILAKIVSVLGLVFCFLNNSFFFFQLHVEHEPCYDH